MKTLLAFAVILLACGCGSLVHVGKGFSGRVVDEATGDPLPGVIVVAQWQPYYVGPVHAPGHSGVVHVYETVTDKDGRYSIPGWGPKPLPAGSEIRSADPALSFFKPGYFPFAAGNTPVSDRAARPTAPGVSEWDGKVVKLRTSAGISKAYGTALEVLSRSLVEARENWRAYPRMIYALWQEENRLPKDVVGPFSRLTPIDVEGLNREERRFLEERGR